MSRKRTFTVRVNIDDMAAMLAGLDGPLEKAEWLDGYMVGVHGHPSRETWSEAKRIGHDFGALHFREVEEFRAEQKAKSDLAEIAKQAKKNPEGTHGLPMGTWSGNPAGDPIQQSTNPTIQRTISEQPKKARQAAHSSPTEKEWGEHCAQTYPDWHPICIAESWAYYESVKWRTRAGPIKDWKRAAVTAHGNARQWNKLQPGQRQGSSWNQQPQKPLAFTPGDLDGIDMEDVAKL